MTRLDVLTVEKAASPAREALYVAGKAVAFAPSLIGVMAHARPLAQAYLAVGRLFDKTRFNAADRQTVLVIIGARNKCDYLWPRTSWKSSSAAA